MADDQEPTPAPKTKVVQPIGTDPRTGKPYKPIEVPLRRRGLWATLFKRPARPKKP